MSVAKKAKKIVEDYSMIIRGHRFQMRGPGTTAPPAGDGPDLE